MRQRVWIGGFFLFGSGVLAAACATGSTDLDDGSGGKKNTTTSTTTSTTTTTGTTTTTTTNTDTTTTTDTTSGTTTTTTTSGTTTSTTTSSTTSSTTTTTTTSSTSSCTTIDLIDDGGFEAGALGGIWSESSTNFGTPVCDASCLGAGATFGPYAGAWFAWFGGISANDLFCFSTVYEAASVAQSVVIGSGGTATLRFRFAIPACAYPADANDSFTVKVDNTTVFSATNSDASCGVTTYQQISLNVSQFANGAAHTISFSSVTDDCYEVTDFLVDNVELIACP